MLFNEMENVILYAVGERNLEAIEILQNDIVLEDKNHFRKMLHYYVCRELDQGNIKGKMHEIVKILYGKDKLNINATQVLEKPIIFYYLYYREFELAEELLQMGANVNVKVDTGAQNDIGYLMEPMICEFIIRMNPERDFPDEFEDVITWLKSKGADETIEPDVAPFNRTPAREK
jgi:hypothetical protein